MPEQGLGTAVIEASIEQRAHHEREEMYQLMREMSAKLDRVQTNQEPILSRQVSREGVS